MHSKHAAVFATLLGLIASLAAPASAQTPRRGGVFNFHSQGEPANLDCQQSVTVFSQAIVRPLYSNLIRFDERDYPKLGPDLAVSWTVSPHSLTYTFKLAPNVTFHDG